MDDKKPVGRPKLGETRKISLTLPSEIWAYIENEYLEEEGANWKVSSALRDMLESHYIVVQAQRGQLDIYEAIQRAQAVDKS